MFKARLTKVNVDINKAWSDHLAGGVECLRAGRINVSGYFADYTIFNSDIGYLVKFLGRVNDAAILDYELTH